MTPAPDRFSWIETLRAIRRPGPPPPGFVPAATLLMTACLVAVFGLIWLGWIWYDKPHRLFAEHKPGTYLSVLNLLTTGAMSVVISRRLGAVPFARFWRLAAVGFVWLGCDDLFALHEQIDRGAHVLLGWDSADPLADRLEDLIVAAYGLVALLLAYRYRVELARLTWMQIVLGIAFALFTVMVIADFVHWPKALEEGLKVVAGTTIVVGFLAARLQLAQLGLARRPTFVAYAYAWRPQ
jgi:hypothetical protein